MNIKLLLSKMITLLFRESQMKNGTDSKEFVRSLVASLKISESNLQVDHENRVMIALRNIVLDMVRRNDVEPMDYITVNQNLRLACEENTTLYESIRDSIALPLDQESLVHVIQSTRRDLNNYIKEQNIKDYISKQSSMLRFNPQEIPDMNAFVKDMVSTLNQYQSKTTEEKDPAIVSEISFNNPEQIAEVFKSVRESASGDSVIKTPWQGLNRMIRGGWRRDQLAVVSAITHHGKSLICAGAICGAALYNDPFRMMNDPTKKPMLLLISSEDDMPKIVSQMYSFVRENIDNVKVDDAHLASMDPVAASQYLSQKLTVKGYTFDTLRVNPSMWTLHDIMSYISARQAQGYEIHLLVVDYLNMFPKTGLFGDSDVSRIQNLFQQFRNFTSANKIAAITPHQMSSDALELLRSGKRDIVKQVAMGSYYEGCKGIGREVDLEIAICKVVESGRTYMAMHRGKHRLQGKTPDKDLYTVYMFEDIGGLRFDVEGQDLSLSKVGSTRREDGSEETPFWGDEDGGGSLF